MTDGPVSTCEYHGEFSMHTGCLKCQEAQAVRDFPIHTLDAARRSLMQLKVGIRNAQSTAQRVTLQGALDRLYKRWPDLSGGIDEVRVSSR